jgi:EmrB/QacA subfamily drug resistance transporter
MLPSSLSIITDLYREQKERARAIGIWAGIGSIGAISGPIVGGILLAHFWWGSVFLVNVPIVVIALVLAMIFVPASNDPAQARLDSLGAVLSIIGLSMLVWTIIEAPSKPLTNTVLTGGVTAVVFLSFVLWERHTPRPMLDLTLFKSPRFTVASMAITTSLFSVAGMTFLLAQYLQNVQGLSPVDAAIHFAPWAITFLFLSPLSPRVAERFGLKRMVVIGIATQALGMALLSQIGADTPYLFLVGALLVMAIGGSAAMPPATDAVMGSVPRERAGMASAVSGTTRQMGSALGVAIMGSALAAGYAASLGDLPSQLGLTGAQRSAAEGSLGGATSVAHAIGGSQGDHLASSAQDAFLHGMHLAVLLSAVLLFAVSMLALRYLPRDERADDYTVEEMALTPDFLSGGEAVIPVVFADAAQDDVEPPRRR